MGLPFPALSIPVMSMAKALFEHMDLCLLSLLIASGIAFPTGLLVARNRIGLNITQAGLGLLYTVPSLAMLAMLVPWLGLGKPSAIVALVLYAQYILLRSVISGLQAVDSAMLDAARGLGLSATQIFWRIEAPIAMPVWINGLRNATLATLSIATTAAWINAGGLGTLIFDGLSQNNMTKIMTGAVLISALSLLFDFGLKAVETESTRIAQGELS